MTEACPAICCIVNASGPAAPKSVSTVLRVEWSTASQGSPVGFEYSPGSSLASFIRDLFSHSRSSRQYFSPANCVPGAWSKPSLSGKSNFGRSRPSPRRAEQMDYSCVALKRQVATHQGRLSLIDLGVGITKSHRERRKVGRRAVVFPLSVMIEA